MQHLGGYRSFAKAFFPLALFMAIFAHAPVKANDYPHRMQLSTDGQILSLLIRPSLVTADLKVTGITGARQTVPVRTYTGIIEGDDNSWVRLTQSANSLDGVISRYGKRFRLQQSGNRPASITPLAHNHDRRISFASRPVSRVATRTQNKKTKVTRIAKIAIAVDSKFNARHNGKGLDYALALVNAVDGIYREEFGLALQVVSAINVVDAGTDPFNYGNVAIESMLRGFRDYRLRSTLIDPKASLVHLFSGNRPTDEPVGLAWIDTACRTDGYDVGISTHYTHDILLVAHEIAHNLGAMHDNETACAASSDKVMWPYISAGTSQHFSSCTVETVKRSLATSCHAIVPDPELALSNDNAEISTIAATDTDPVPSSPVAALAIDYPDTQSLGMSQGKSQGKSQGTDNQEIDITPAGDSVVYFQIDTNVSRDLFNTAE